MTWADLSRAERVEAVRSQIALTPKAKETELADALGATRELVRHIIRYYGLQRGSPDGWAGMNKAERIGAIVTLLRDHPRLRDQDIAERLGTSRDSISWHIRVGHIRRPVSAGEKRRAPRPEPVRRGTGFKFGNPISDVRTLPKDVDPIAFNPLPWSTPKSLVDLAPLRHDGTSAECHWPVGEMFCACPTDGTSRYCKVHTKRSGKMVPRLVFA